MAKHKNKQPKPKLEEKLSISPQPKQSKFKLILLRLRIPKPMRYILKILISLMSIVLLVQLAFSVLDYITQLGMVRIASVTDDASKSLLASQLNQHLNLTTYIFALLIGAAIIVFVWKLIAQPVKRTYRRFVSWLNK